MVRGKKAGFNRIHPNSMESRVTETEGKKGAARIKAARNQFYADNLSFEKRSIAQGLYVKGQFSQPPERSFR